jgi:hypothetical protein
MTYKHNTEKLKSRKTKRIDQDTKSQRPSFSYYLVSTRDLRFENPSSRVKI